MGGYALGSAFDSKAGQMIMAGSLYLGTIFGNNAPIYISQNTSNSSSSSASSSSLPDIYCTSLSWSADGSTLFKIKQQQEQKTKKER